MAGRAERDNPVEMVVQVEVDDQVCRACLTVAPEVRTVEMAVKVEMAGEVAQEVVEEMAAQSCSQRENGRWLRQKPFSVCSIIPEREGPVARVRLTFLEAI